MRNSNRVSHQRSALFRDELDEVDVLDGPLQPPADVTDDGVLETGADVGHLGDDAVGFNA